MDHNNNKMLMVCSIDNFDIEIQSNAKYNEIYMSSSDTIKIHKFISNFKCNWIHNDVKCLTLICQNLTKIPDLHNNLEMLCIDNNKLSGDIVIHYPYFSAMNNNILSALITKTVKRVTLTSNNINKITIHKNNILSHMELKYNNLVSLDLSTTSIKTIDVSNNKLKIIFLPNTIKSALLNCNPLHDVQFPNSKLYTHTVNELNIIQTQMTYVPNNIYINKLYASNTNIHSIPMNATNITISCNDIDMISSYYDNKYVTARNCRIYKLLATNKWNVDIWDSKPLMVDNLKFMPDIMPEDNPLLFNTAACCIQRNWKKYLKNKRKDISVDIWI